jgi:hypothetical protein
MPDDQIPILPVENPILCSPYQEPDQHWLCDTNTGIPSKTPGRRPASYWFKTERTGSAQMSLLAEEARDDLPLVNALREDVRRWRESRWENASGLQSLPFPRPARLGQGETWRVAVKVIDPRGNEGLRVLTVME